MIRILYSKATIFALIYLVHAIVLSITAYVAYDNGYYTNAMLLVPLAPLFLIGAGFVLYKQEVDKPVFLISSLLLFTLLAGVLLLNIHQKFTIAYQAALLLPLMTFLILKTNVAFVFNMLFAIASYATLSETDNYSVAFIYKFSSSYLLLTVMIGLISHTQQYLQFNMLKLSTTNPATNIDNELGLAQRLNQEVARSEFTTQPLSLMVIQIQDFKRIKDAHSEKKSVELLSTLGNELKKNLRSDDFLFQLTEDTLIIVLPNITQDGAMVAEERVIRAIDEKEWESIITLQIRASSATLLPNEQPDEFLDRLLCRLEYHPQFTPVMGIGV